MIDLSTKDFLSFNKTSTEHSGEECFYKTALPAKPKSGSDTIRELRRKRILSQDRETPRLTQETKRVMSAKSASVYQLERPQCARLTSKSEQTDFDLTSECSNRLDLLTSIEACNLLGPKLCKFCNEQKKIANTKISKDEPDLSIALPLMDNSLYESEYPSANPPILHSAILKRSMESREERIFLQNSKTKLTMKACPDRESKFFKGLHELNKHLIGLHDTKTTYRHVVPNKEKKLAKFPESESYIDPSNLIDYDDPDITPPVISVVNQKYDSKIFN